MVRRIEKPKMLCLAAKKQRKIKRENEKRKNHSSAEYLYSNSIPALNEQHQFDTEILIFSAAKQIPKAEALRGETKL